MNVILELKDDQYPFNGVDRIRHCARGVVLDEKGNVGITHLYVEQDAFGGRNYYELPGGGVKGGETPLEAACREMKEELGVEVEVITELGVVHDFYNLIKQENYSHYYLFKVKGHVTQQLEERESHLIDRIEWLPLETLLDIFKKYDLPGVGLLVKRREYPILLRALDYIQKHC